MRLQLLFAALLILTLLLPTPVRAQHDVLNVAFSEHPPWKVLDKDGIPGGIDIAFLRMLADRLDLDLQFHHVPFKRGLAMLQSGELDIMTGVLKRPVRELYLHFIEPAYKNSSNKAFYVRKGQESLITRHEDLSGLDIGTGLGAKYYPRFDTDKSFIRHPVSDADLSIKMLLVGRVDAFIMTESAGDYRLALQGLSRKVGKAGYIYREKQGVYMVLSKNSIHTERLADFNRVMAEMVNEGVMNQIKADFYKATETRNKHP